MSDRKRIERYDSPFVAVLPQALAVLTRVRPDVKDKINAEIFESAHQLHFLELCTVYRRSSYPALRSAAFMSRRKVFIRG